MSSAFSGLDVILSPLLGMAAKYGAFPQGIAFKNANLNRRIEMALDAEAVRCFVNLRCSVSRGSCVDVASPQLPYALLRSLFTLHGASSEAVL